MSEAEAPFDAERILRALAEHGVELIPAPEPANLKRLALARRPCPQPGDEETPVDAKMLPQATIWQFATPVGGVDVMHEVPGGRPYAELSERALHVQLGDIDVPVVDLDDLIQMKLARGRPTDLADVAALTDPRLLALSGTRLSPGSGDATRPVLGAGVPGRAGSRGDRRLPSSRPGAHSPQKRTYSEDFIFNTCLGEIAELETGSDDLHHVKSAAAGGQHETPRSRPSIAQSRQQPARVER